MAMQTTDTLLAAPRGSFEEAVAFFRRMGSSRFEHVTMYLRTVYDIAPKVGLDPAVMVAHASHETDYFKSYWWVKRLNPAGMGVTGYGPQNELSPYFKDGVAAAKAHMAHMLLYAQGEITSPLTAQDNPRYKAYLDSYGDEPQAERITDLEWKWAWDDDFAEGVARQGNEIFKNLPNSKPIEKDEPQGIVPSKIVYQGKVWDGAQSIRLNNNLYRARRRTVTVNVDKLNIRVYADTSTPIIRTANRGERIDVIGYVVGQKVGSEARWWISKNHERIWVGGTSEKP